MARPSTPTLPDDKVDYFREQLYRELSHMFEWEGLPDTVPGDYIERNLVRFGYLLFYKDEGIGLDVLRTTTIGFNRHDLPATAYTYVNTTTGEVRNQVKRNIKYLSDSEDCVERFDENTDGVIMCNMAFGESAKTIVDHYAQRMALVQQAIDTNLLWANVPYIFQTGSDQTKLSIEKMFGSIFEGKPFIITDKEMFEDNKDRTGVPTGVKFIGKELMDTLNELKMGFKQTVGFDTAGVEKAERVLQGEIDSNKQHTQSVVQVMLSQRLKACEAINVFFGTSLSVRLVGQKELEEEQVLQDELMEEGEEDGTGDSGTAAAAAAE